MVGPINEVVIGRNKVGLEPKGETTISFVITSSQPFTTTNLTAKVTFSRVVMGSGQIADTLKMVNVNRQ
jgi:hypothetical protein